VVDAAIGVGADGAGDTADAAVKGRRMMRKMPAARRAAKEEVSMPKTPRTAMASAIVEGDGDAGQQVGDQGGVDMAG